MRLRKELLVVLYVCILLLNDPQLLRACTLDTCTNNIGLGTNISATINPFKGTDDS